MKSDDRRLKILECVVDTYIETGDPVGSAAVCKMLGGSVSSATIRNDMATLERLGFLEQPHTSAGRVPTYIGFRMYINRLMKPKDLSEETKAEIDEKLALDTSSVSAVIDNAISALSEVTGLATVSSNELPKFSVITKVEVVPAGRRLYAVLLITSTGDVKNKICRMEFDISDEQIDFFEDIINESLQGVSIDSITPSTLQNLSAAMGSYMFSLSPLLYTFFELSNEISNREVDLKGEGNLLSYNDVSPNDIMQFITAKDQIENILSSAFTGINVVFGKENNTFAVGNSSLILTKFGPDDSLGSFGVIGPIRLDYEKVIPYISYFSESISKIIDNMLEDNSKGEYNNGEKIEEK